MTARFPFHTGPVTPFQLVSEMNEAFGNPKGDPANINWPQIRRQSISVGHEFCELLTALGGDTLMVSKVLQAIDGVLFPNKPDLEATRDAACDGHVFSYGIHHLLGLSADSDMRTVVSAVMTRFIKDDTDKAMTIAKHAAKGVTEVYFEGEYPQMIMKSAVDQPDAPKGKFLKSASFSEPHFYAPLASVAGDYRAVVEGYYVLGDMKLHMKQGESLSEARARQEEGRAAT